MPGSTANQGFSFALAGDAPCSWAVTEQLLASQVETKSVGFDTDSARVAANNMVKISKSNASAIGFLSYDTVEFNRGTPTDLSVYNGVLLNPGYYLIGGEAQVITTSAGNNTSKYFSGGIQGAVGFVASDIAASGYSLTVEGTFSNTNGPAPWPNTAVGASAVVQATTPNTHIRFAPGGSTIDSYLYVQMWAFQIGDL